MHSFWNTISQLCQLRLTCYFLISCRYCLQLQAWLFLLMLSFMFARVTPIIHAVVGSIATNQTCTEMDKSRTSAPVINCVAVWVNQELCAVLHNLTARGGDRVTTYDFSSTSFLFDWIFKRRFLCRIRAYHLDDYDTLPLIETAGIEVIDEVNRTGGWTCIMW